MTNINEYYKASLVADKKSANTIKNYLLYVGKMLAFVNKPVEEISFLDLTAWKASISNLSTASMNIQISAIKSYFKFLTRLSMRILLLTLLLLRLRIRKSIISPQKM